MQCQRGSQWLLQNLAESRRYGSSPDDFAGLTADFENRIRSSKSPLVLIRGPVTVETCRAAVEFAERFHGLLDIHRSAQALAQLLAFQQLGKVTASWGEVAARADICLFLFADPKEALPRWWQRLDLDSPPRMNPRQLDHPEGTPGRLRIGIDSKRTRTLEACDVQVLIEPDMVFELLPVLRALFVDGVSLSELSAHLQSFTDRGASVNAADFSGLSIIQKTLCETSYVAFVRGAIAGGEGGDQGGAHRPESECRAAGAERAFSESWSQLVADINRHRKCVSIELDQEMNRTAEEVLTWQTGFPGCLDFSSGLPTFDPLRKQRKRLDPCGCSGLRRERRAVFA